MEVDKIHLRHCMDSALDTEWLLLVELFHVKKRIEDQSLSGRPNELENDELLAALG